MHLCVCVFHVVFSTRTLNISYNAVKKKHSTENLENN